MATAAEWAEGYLAQAQVELTAARQSVDASVRAMLVQMVTEKVAKAGLLKNGQWTIERTQATHRGASHMLMLLLQRRNLAKLPYKRNTIEHVLKPLVDLLESLQPAVARAQGREEGPWLEYPWPTPLDTIAVPARDLPELHHFRGRSSRSAQLIRFAEVLIDRHDHLFG